MSVLSGVRILEFEGLGPGPFCGMLLADMGADVIVVERAGGPSSGAGKAGVYRRGKRSILLDLKKPAHVRAAIEIAKTVDATIEGLRPGVMERLGLGPDILHAVHPALVYGRLTGWGQSGPMAHTAGHDVNYVSLAGAAWYAGAPEGAPLPPPTLVGDIGGGALYLAVGILGGVLNARETGKGRVVDAAIVDGAAHMTSLMHSLRAVGGLPETRGQSMIDGAPFYGVYQCADGAHVSIGPLEPKFYAMLLDKLALTADPDFKSQFDQTTWAPARKKLTALFLTQPAAHWRDLLEGSDVCFAPVLSPSAAATHPHIAAREIYRTVDGVFQAAAAPRFDGQTPADPPAPPTPGAHRDEILSAAGLTSADLD